MNIRRSVCHKNTNTSLIFLCRFPSPPFMMPSILEITIKLSLSGIMALEKQTLRCVIWFSLSLLKFFRIWRYLQAKDWIRNEPYCDNDVTECTTIPFILMSRLKFTWAPQLDAWSCRNCSSLGVSRLRNPNNEVHQQKKEELRKQWRIIFSLF